MLFLIPLSLTAMSTYATVELQSYEFLFLTVVLAVITIITLLCEELNRRNQ